MTGRQGILLATTLLVAGAACSRTGTQLDVAAYEQEIRDWRANRLEHLLAPDGYLTQIGLYWLDPGTYSFGADETCDIVVPALDVPRVGVFHVTLEGVRFAAADGVEVLAGDTKVTAIDMPADITGHPVVLSHGSLAWMVIDRAGHIGIRVRDYKHPFLATFGPLPYYDIDPAWRVAATFHPYDQPRKIAVDTVIEGFQQFPEAPGTVTFEIDGREFELEPTLSDAGDKLFFVFGDATGRDATYGAGRFLYADMPGADGTTILDFNKAYSPPCAFNDFSTCPVASPRNRLPIRIEAGEKYDPALHYAGSAAAANGH